MKAQLFMHCLFFKQCSLEEPILELIPVRFISSSHFRNHLDQHPFCRHQSMASILHYSPTQGGALLVLLTFVLISTARMESHGLWRKAMDLWLPSKSVSYLWSHLLWAHITVNVKTNICAFTVCLLHAQQIVTNIYTVYVLNMLLMLFCEVKNMLKSCLKINKIKTKKLYVAKLILWMNWDGRINPSTA